VRGLNILRDVKSPQSDVFRILHRGPPPLKIQMTRGSVTSVHWNDWTWFLLMMSPIVNSFRTFLRGQRANTSLSPQRPLTTPVCITQLHQRSRTQREIAQAHARNVYGRQWVRRPDEWDRTRNVHAPARVSRTRDNVGLCSTHAPPQNTPMISAARGLLRWRCKMRLGRPSTQQGRKFVYPNLFGFRNFILFPVISPSLSPHSLLSFPFPPQNPGGLGVLWLHNNWQVAQQ